jgi:hypothetical protein
LFILPEAFLPIQSVGLPAHAFLPELQAKAVICCFMSVLPPALLPIRSIGLPARLLAGAKAKAVICRLPIRSVGPPAHACLPELKAEAVLIRDACASATVFPE